VELMAKMVNANSRETMAWILRDNNEPLSDVVKELRLWLNLTCMF